VNRDGNLRADGEGLFPTLLSRLPRGNACGFCLADPVKLPPSATAQRRRMPTEPCLSGERGFGWCSVLRLKPERQRSARLSRAAVAQRRQRRPEQRGQTEQPLPRGNARPPERTLTAPENAGASEASAPCLHYPICKSWGGTLRAADQLVRKRGVTAGPRQYGFR